MQMAPVLCDVGQMGCHADNVTDDKAMWAFEVLRNCLAGDRCCATWCQSIVPM